MNRLLVFGLGYSGRAVAELAAGAGWDVVGTSRKAEVAPDSPPPLEGLAHVAAQALKGRGGVGVTAFASAHAAIAGATHILATAAPGPEGDPVLALYADAIRAAPHLRWIGYLSSTVVYGDRGGGWVEEDTPPAPSQERGHRRRAAEVAWEGFADRCAVEIFRLAGIYGPTRSMFDDLRDGRARRMVKVGHAFGRIHRDDIARAVLAAMAQDRPSGTRVLNLNDDEPAESAAVVTEAARLLGVPLPPEVAFEAALPTMSPMARSFWAENRKVASRQTKAALGIEWLYPTYREGLRAILAEESGDRPA